MTEGAVLYIRNLARKQIRQTYPITADLEWINEKIIREDGTSVQPSHHYNHPNKIYPQYHLSCHAYRKSINSYTFKTIIFNHAYDSLGHPKDAVAPFVLCSESPSHIFFISSLELILSYFQYMMTR